MTRTAAGHSLVCMKHEPVASGPRRTITLSLAEEYAADAEALGIDLEGALDRALATEIKRERDRRWKQDNREAIAEWNAWVEENGLPLADYRAF